MTYVQRNPNPWPATLPEVRDEDGRVWPTVEVPPDGEVQWPQRIAGFEGFPDPEPLAAAEAEAPAAEQPAKADEPTDTATPAPVKNTKSKSATPAVAGGKEA